MGEKLEAWKTISEGRIAQEEGRVDEGLNLIEESLNWEG
jgi:hypothetical protein